MADTIVRTVELGVRITDAAIAGETTVLWCDLLTDGPGRCPGCGLAGVYRDSVERRVTAAVRAVVLRDELHAYSRDLEPPSPTRNRWRTWRRERRVRSARRRPSR